MTPGSLLKEYLPQFWLPKCAASPSQNIVKNPDLKHNLLKPGDLSLIPVLVQFL